MLYKNKTPLFIGHRGSPLKHTENTPKSLLCAFNDGADGVDIDVRNVDLFCLLGPNGSGKSTTIKLLLGLLRPTKGFIKIFDRDPDDVRTKERIGYLPEES